MSRAEHHDLDKQKKFEEPHVKDVEEIDDDVRDDTFDLLYTRTLDVMDALERVQWAAGVLRRFRARNEHNVLEILLGNVAIAEERMLKLRTEAIQLLDIVKIRYNRER